MKRIIQNIKNNINAKKSMSNDTFCPAAWIEISSRVNGSWGLCCKSNRLPYTVYSISPLEHFNSDEMKKIRLAMVRNDKKFLSKYCLKCYMAEEASGHSRRLDLIKHQNRNTKQKQIVKTMVIETLKNPSANIIPQYIGLVETKVFGNLCNLKCRMCNPMSSSAFAKEKKDMKELPQDYQEVQIPWDKMSVDVKNKFLDDMKTLLKVTKEIKFSGGEPFISTTHYEFLDFIISNGLSKDLKLDYVSNLTSIPTINGKNILDYLPNFKSVNISVSIDGIEELTEYIRYGSNFQNVLSNIRQLKNIPNVNLKVVSCISALNVTRLDQIYDFFEKENIKIYFRDLLVSPGYLQCWNIPKPLKDDAIRRFSNHKAKKSFERIINSLKKESDAKLYDEFVRRTKKLDKHRGTDLLNVLPEFKEYF